MSTAWKQAIVNDLTKFTYQHWTVMLHATRDMTLEEYTPLTPLTDSVKIFEQYWNMRNNPIRFGSRYPKIMRGVLTTYMRKELDK